MVLKRIKLRSERARLLSDCFDLLLALLLRSCESFCLQANESVHGLFLLGARMQPSPVLGFFKVLLTLPVDDSLVHRYQHVQHRLVLVLFVDFARHFTRLSLDGCSESAPDLWGVQVWVVPVVEDRVVAQSVAQVGQLGHVAVRVVK